MHGPQRERREQRFGSLKRGPGGRRRIRRVRVRIGLPTGFPGVATRLSGQGKVGRLAGPQRDLCGAPRGYPVPERARDVFVFRGGEPGPFWRPQPASPCAVSRTAASLSSTGPPIWRLR